MKINITKIDNVFMKIDCDEMSLELLIRDRYTFLVPGYKFMPKYKLGLWDGKIRLYDQFKKTLYLGLIEDLVLFCQENNIDIILNNPEDFDGINENITKQELEDFIKKLNLKYTPYDYQFNSVFECLSNGRKIISSPTSSGKSLIIYISAMYHYVKSQRVLIIVPTIALCSQMVRDFKNYSNDKINENHINIINYEARQRAKKDKNAKHELDYPFVVSTWQSIYKNKESWFDNFDVIIADECHTYKSDAIKKMMENTGNVKKKYGLTATISNDMYEVPSSKDSPNTMTLMGLFGSISRTATTKELMDRNIIAKLKIKMITMNHDSTTKSMLAKKNFDYASEMKIIGENVDRRNKIVKMVKNIKGNSILLFNFAKTFGIPLYEQLKNEMPDHKIFYVDKSTSGEDRATYQKIADEEDNVIIVASYGVFSTGISINNIHNVFFITPYKALTRILQSIGRGLRMKDGKTHCNLYDIIDDIKGKRTNITLNHSQDRYKIYLRENFDDIKFYNIDLNKEKK